MRVSKIVLSVVSEEDHGELFVLCPLLTTNYLNASFVLLFMRYSDEHYIYIIVKNKQDHHNMDG